MKKTTKRKTLELLKDELLIGLINEENRYPKVSKKIKFDFDLKEWYNNSIENAINEFAVIHN